VFAEREPTPTREPIAARITVWSSPSDGALHGGDWYAVRELSNDVTLLTIGDVAGHGDAVAPVMHVMFRSVLEALETTRDPSSVLARANVVACEIDDGRIATGIVAVLDRTARTLSFANAGHPMPIAVTERGGSFFLPSVGQLPLGIYWSQTYATRVVEVSPDSLIVMYTDGITEHARDTIAGEIELAEACAVAFASSERDVARVIAERVLRTGRGDDDAAIVAIRIGS
jgi:serine phosphatase RsbU (regulator of sigma subunit)